MNGIRHRFVLAALAATVLWAPNMASAGVRIGIGFGTTIGPRHHSHVHGWYGGWHAWPHYSWYDPWWHYPGPVIVGPPVIVERPVVRERIVVREHRPPAPPKEPAPDLLSERLQQKKSESLKKLKIGDPAHRAAAAKDLEPFAADSRVRTALEQALLADRDPQVRKTVAELFGRVQDKKTLKALKQAHADDPDRDVRQAAYRAILLMEGY